MKGGGTAVRGPASGQSDSQEEVGKEENIVLGRV